jgi:hypothetical protein
VLAASGTLGLESFYSVRSPMTQIPLPTGRCRRPPASGLSVKNSFSTTLRRIRIRCSKSGAHRCAVCNDGGHSTVMAMAPVLRVNSNFKSSKSGTPESKDILNPPENPRGSLGRPKTLWSTLPLAFSSWNRNTA